MDDIFNIKDFSNYLNVSAIRDENVHIIYYGFEKNQLLQSDPINVDFYMLSIKPLLHNNMIRQELWEDQSDSYIIINNPDDPVSWEIEEPSLGYTIMVNGKYLNKLGKDFDFIHYSSYDEALFLRKSESEIIWDLYQKTYNEFQKDKHSPEIISSYISLIFTYTQSFYERQFSSRSNIYDKVVADFLLNLKEYFDKKEISGLPSVAYFANQSHLSANYFGDLVKRFTNKSPGEHIQQNIVEIAKEKLINSDLSISEISYSLGFDYPNYFARFFKKRTGVSPKTFRLEK